MRVAIMQPYFLPYIGYFQLMAATDLFVVYDNIKYTKKGWINRNRMLVNGEDEMFSLPLKAATDTLDIRDREIAADFDSDKLTRKFAAAYRRAPYFSTTMPLLESILASKERNLFQFLLESIRQSCSAIGLVPNIQVSSAIDADHGLKGQERVLAICEATRATTYINPPGGVELYSRAVFDERHIELKFLRPQPLEYAQFERPFVPWLSIVDVMMFISPAEVRNLVQTRWETF